MKMLSIRTNALIRSQYFLCQECIAIQSVSHYKLDRHLDLTILITTYLHFFVFYKKKILLSINTKTNLNTIFTYFDKFFI